MATHDSEKHTRQSLRRSPEFRELAELMAGIDHERRADAFTLAGIQENDSDGQEELQGVIGQRYRRDSGRP